VHEKNDDRRKYSSFAGHLDHHVDQGSGSMMPSTSPSTAGRGLPYMPLDAAITQVFNLYRPVDAMVINFGVKK
jgi:hypothetical protein